MLCCKPSGAAQGIGVAPVVPTPTNSMFTEISIPEIVKLPKAKPDMEELLSVAVDAEIISTRLIETASGHSVENQTLTGHKLVVELKLKQKVKYIADECTQSVHAAHFEKLIHSIYIVVTDISAEFAVGRVVVTPYVEDIYAVARDKRTIFKNITLLLNVTILP